MQQKVSINQQTTANCAEPQNCTKKHPTVIRLGVLMKKGNFVSPTTLLSF